MKPYSLFRKFFSIALIISIVSLSFPSFALENSQSNVLLKSNYLMANKTPPANTAPPKIIFNKKELKFDVAPIIENGRVLVPMRTIFEEFGAVVSWDGPTKTVTAIKGSTTIELTIDGYAYKNGREIVLFVPARIVQNRTLVPLRFVSEAMGAKVEWDDVTRTVIITP